MNDESKILRTFIAFKIERGVKEELVRIQQKLKRELARDFKVNWLHPEAMHLTLAFLGNTPEAKIPEITSILDRVALLVEG